MADEGSFDDDLLGVSFNSACLSSDIAVLVRQKQIKQQNLLDETAILKRRYNEAFLAQQSFLKESKERNLVFEKEETQILGELERLNSAYTSNQSKMHENMEKIMDLRSNVQQMSLILDEYSQVSLEQSIVAEKLEKMQENHSKEVKNLQDMLSDLKSKENNTRKKIEVQKVYKKCIQLSRRIQATRILTTQIEEEASMLSLKKSPERSKHIQNAIINTRKAFKTEALRVREYDREIARYKRDIQRVDNEIIEELKKSAALDHDLANLEQKILLNQIQEEQRIRDVCCLTNELDFVLRKALLSRDLILHNQFSYREPETPGFNAKLSMKILKIDQKLADLELMIENHQERRCSLGLEYDNLLYKMFFTQSSNEKCRSELMRANESYVRVLLSDIPEEELQRREEELIARRKKLQNKTDLLSRVCYVQNTCFFKNTSLFISRNEEFSVQNTKEIVFKALEKEYETKKRAFISLRQFYSELKCQTRASKVVASLFEEWAGVLSGMTINISNIYTKKT